MKEREGEREIETDRTRENREKHRQRERQTNGQMNVNEWRGNGLIGTYREEEKRKCMRWFIKKDVEVERSVGREAGWTWRREH